MPSPIPNADTQPPTARTTAPRRRRAPELLAPAGDAAALTAALKAGCDAAYVGAKSFSMRGAAGNFTLSALRRAADQCHSRQACLYVAVNTIVYDGEQRTMLRLLDRLAGVADAVICWDPAVIAGCRERGIPIHISTQASVASTAAARFYRDLGAERVVLARECTLADIRAIGRRAGIGVEVFAHGAMCVSISGRCFLSQLSEGSSGNRGLCRQTCRRPFRVICQDGPADFEVFPGDSHVFSARDLCTLPFLDQLLDARPVSLKIEGRNRPADYVDTVIRAYREAIDAWTRGQLDDDLKRDLAERCRRVFNRQFSDGFYFGRPIADFTPVQNSAATEKRSYLGRILNYYARSGIALAALHNGPLRDGDTAVIIGPTTGSVRLQAQGVRLEETHDGHRTALTATFAVPERVRAGDALYLVRPAAPTTPTTTPPPTQP